MIIEKSKIILEAKPPYTAYREFHCKKNGCSSNCKYEINNNSNINSNLIEYYQCRLLYFDTHYISVSLGASDDATKFLIKDKISIEEWISMFDVRDGFCREAMGACSNCKWGRNHKAIFVDIENKKIDISRYLSCINYYRLMRKEKDKYDNS